LLDLFKIQNTQYNSGVDDLELSIGQSAASSGW